MEIYSGTGATVARKINHRMNCSLFLKNIKNNKRKKTEKNQYTSCTGKWQNAKK